MQFCCMDSCKFHLWYVFFDNKTLKVKCIVVLFRVKHHFVLKMGFTRGRTVNANVFSVAMVLCDTNDVGSDVTKISIPGFVFKPTQPNPLFSFSPIYNRRT